MQASVVLRLNHRTECSSCFVWQFYAILTKFMTNLESLNNVFGRTLWCLCTDNNTFARIVNKWPQFQTISECPLQLYIRPAKALNCISSTTTETLPCYITFHTVITSSYTKCNPLPGDLLFTSEMELLSPEGIYDGPSLFPLTCSDTQIQPVLHLEVWACFPTKTRARDSQPAACVMFATIGLSVFEG